MKLTPISKEEVYEEAYEDYCGDMDTPLSFDKWMETEEAKLSIKRWFALLGMNEESK